MAGQYLLTGNECLYGTLVVPPASFCDVRATGRHKLSITAEMH